MRCQRGGRTVVNRPEIPKGREPGAHSIHHPRLFHRAAIEEPLLQSPGRDRMSRHHRSFLTLTVVAASFAPAASALALSGTNHSETLLLDA